MLRSPHRDQENIPVGVAALVTPARHPLKNVLDTRVNTPTRSKHVDPYTRSLFKSKRKSKRLSAPSYNLTRLIPEVVKVFHHSPVLESTASVELKSVSPGTNGKRSCDTVPREEREAVVDEFVEKVVKKILKEVEKNESQVKQESSPKKMEEYESIILQMNKERLRLERQLADLMKGQSKSRKLASSSTASIDTRTIALEKEVETKTNELCEMKKELVEVQDMLLELPVIRSDLIKSRQETKGLNGVLFSSRKENADQKDLISKLKKEIKEKETCYEQQHSEFRKSIDDLSQERDQNLSEFQRLSKLVEQKDEQLKRNTIHCQNLNGVVNRLENVAVEAEKYVSLSKENETVLQYQIDELSLSLETNSQLVEESECRCQETLEELRRSRQNEKETKEHCQKLLAQVDALVAEMDVHKMEIARQQDVIDRQQMEMDGLKVELSVRQEQMESMQSQHQEMNEFTEEERRNLEITVREMENQLKQTSQEMTELNASLRGKSTKCTELVEEVQVSRSLLQDKQEELDATQSQAHWIVLQQEAVMAETSKELNDISDLVNDLLRKFTKEAFLEQLEEEGKPEPEVRSPASEGEVTQEPPKSLVQSVLEARALRENEMELKTADNVITIRDIQETEQECSRNFEEEKPLTLTEQVLELKQALRQLVKIGSGQAASVQAQNTIKRLQEQRVTAEQEYTCSLQKTVAELEESRIRETKLRREVTRKCSEISGLRLELKESAENLQQSFRKLELLSQQFEKTIEQQDRITEMTADLHRYSIEVKKLDGDKECLTQQLKQCLATLDELSAPAQPDLDKTQLVLGKVMAEKFNLEKKVQQFKEKAMKYRLEAQDYMTEYKCRADSKIRILEGNVEKAETEICRLDELVEKIRLVLHQYSDVTSACPDLLKLLSFLDGEDIQ